MRRKNKHISARIILSLGAGIIDEISILDLASRGSKHWTGLFWIRGNRARKGGGDLQRSVNRLHSIEQMKNNKRHSWTLKELPRGENCASLAPAVIIISISVPERLAKLQNKPFAPTFSPFLSPFFLSFPLFFSNQKYVMWKISREFN